jgi:hypothetical protein
MNPVEGKKLTNASADGSESESTGLPGFRTWGSIYGFVSVVFVVVVGLLVVLTQLFS